MNVTVKNQGVAVPGVFYRSVCLTTGSAVNDIGCAAGTSYNTTDTVSYPYNASDLGAGLSHTMSIISPGLVGGRYKIYAYADSTSNVFESNETNNSYGLNNVAIGKISQLSDKYLIPMYFGASSPSTLSLRCILRMWIQ